VAQNLEREEGGGTMQKCKLVGIDYGSKFAGNLKFIVKFGNFQKRKFGKFRINFFLKLIFVVKKRILQM